jgi:cysteine-rich repeat protein
MENVIQRDTDLRLGAHVGTINPATGAFDLRAPNPNLFCSSFDLLTGSVAPDGRTYAATGSFELPIPSLGDQCERFDVTETGDHCGNGVPQDAEACDDGNLNGGDGCSALCQVEPCFACSGIPSVCTPAATGACDDDHPCTANDTCAAGGTCSGAPVTCEPCLACDLVLGCVARPQTTCKASTVPAKSNLYVKNDAIDAKDRLIWRWKKGTDTLLSELGNPAAGDDVTLCIFDESAAPASLLFRATIPSGAFWAPTASGFVYKDSSAAADGVTLTALSWGTGAKASALLKGKGVHLSDRPHGLPALPLPLPLRVQLQAENGLCLETRHDASSVLKNDPARGLFKAAGIP